MAWKTEFETGLLDDFDFTIERAFYAPDERYNNGQTTLLQWEGTTDNVDQPDVHTWFPLGKGWESRDGGKTIEHESGKADKYFVKTSLMAKLIARCVDDFGIGDLLEERGDAFTSSVWEGLKFHMKSEVVDFGGGNIDPKAKILPIRFLGVVGDGAKAAVAAPKTASGPSAAEKIAAAKAKAAGGAASGLRAQVVAALKSGGVDAALAIDGVTDDDAILNELMDESSALFVEAAS